MAAPRFSCGVDLESNDELNIAVHEYTQESQFDFLCIDLMQAAYRPKADGGEGIETLLAASQSDLCLTSSQWSSLIVGRLPAWIDPDAADPALHVQAFEAVWSWAVHLSLPCLIAPIRGPQCLNLASRIMAMLARFSHSGMQVWARVPVSAAPKDSNVEVDTWAWWNRLRTFCGDPAKLCVLLELTADLPSEKQLQRWLGEPVKGLIVPVSVFITNAKGFPVLSKSHQAFVKMLIRLNIQFVLSGLPEEAESNRYLMYLEHLHRTVRDAEGSVEKFARGYEDYLQSPLQPLMDNLDSQTYETFEKDPFKYAQYEKSVYKALLDRVPVEEKATRVSVVMVLGAGRGPLVQASLDAAKKADRRVEVYAVEKNPNALVTLRGRKQNEWGDTVTIIASDMRHWQTTIQADIVVSELLGSFGDNELSPECLDGAMRYLKPDAISIPQSYTSYLAPLQSVRLHQEVGDDLRGQETPYVVLLRNVYLCAPPQECFTFTHPNREPVIDNSRYIELSFTATSNSVVHGFAGYFCSALYKDLLMSIHPDTHSPGMFSWFPIYFPIRHPVEVKQGDTIKAHMWRRVDAKRVWYEWCLSSPQLTPIHNVNGRSSSIGL